MPELKPCPFCGSTNITIQHGGIGGTGECYCRCRKCLSDGPWTDGSDEDAIAAWNHRADGVMAVDAPIELPPLPASWRGASAQVQAYARAAVLADRAARGVKEDENA